MRGTRPAAHISHMPTTPQIRNQDINAAGNPGSYAPSTHSAPEFSFSKESTLDGAMERWDHLNDVSQSFNRLDTNRGYEARRIIVVPATETAPEQKFRGHLHKDSSYPNQSRLKVEVWTAGGWSEVVSAPGHSFDNQLPSGYSKTDDIELEDTARRVLGDYMIDAIRIAS